MTHRKRTALLLTALSLLLVAKVATGIWQANDGTSQVETVMATVEDHASTEQFGELNQGAISASVNTMTFLANHVIPPVEAASIPGQAFPGNVEKIYGNEMLTGLRKQKDALDTREQQLNRKEELLQQAEAKVNRRITELEQLEASVKQRLKDEQGIKNKKIKRMTAVFAGMKPDRAAPVMASMDLATVVRIFSLMDEKKVGKILSFLPANKAVSVSQALTRQISSIK